MTSESPRTLRGVNALAAHGKYDLPPGEATLGSLPDRPLAGRLERRGSLALGALFVDWESWLVLAVVLLVAGGMGAWIGEREARRAILAGQSPTLAELRARVQRLRRWIIGGAFVVPRGSEGALEEIDGISRELLDLSLTAPQRSIDPKRPHVKPLGVKVSALVAGMPATALILGQLRYQLTHAQREPTFVFRGERSRRRRACPA